MSSKHLLLATCAASLIALGSQAHAEAAAATTASGGGTQVGEIVVTAERREESLQSTPVAVSAFSQETLNSKGLKGGEDLLLSVPNANYSRSNFGGFNFKIRGVGVDVIAFGGTTGVSINENELPLANNNFANTDFYDVQRVEVLRGPQGTLYGRNATGGAVNIITNQPTDKFEGYATLGYGNYNAFKAIAAVNVPLGDGLALRVAGFRYIQDGFGTNTYLNQGVDGRDLGSLRATLAWKPPGSRFSAYVMYEHYGEHDDRNRIGKQLCVPDPGPTSVGGVPIAPAGGPVATNYAAYLNQGCLPQTLYQDAAYGYTNTNSTSVGLLNFIGANDGTNLNANNPPQDHNLHDIQSLQNPTFVSVQDIVDLHMAYKITDYLTLSSITGFSTGHYYSVEDYNRYIPASPFMPVSTGVLGPLSPLLFPNGVVHDPQIGIVDRPATFDRSTAAATEWTQEVRLASSFPGRFNFSAGFFYSSNVSDPGATNYYVYSSALTAFAQANNAVGGALLGGPVHIDPGMVPDGSGHNYYDARSDSSLHSYAGFGEAYIDLVPDRLKLTLGLRYTVDDLYNISYPISLYVAVPNGTTPYADGYGGFPPTVCTTSAAACLTPQQVSYKEFTGRANLDWTPNLSFTDKTLVYFTYSRGYKGGGFNTPCQASLGSVGGICPYPLSYQPEFINAFELGTKNTLMGGRLLLNLDGFYYDYTGYQISSIVAKSSVNLNINSKIYGVEFESVYSPIDDLTLNLNVGYLHTSINGGNPQIDTINLTQGNPNYTLVHGLDGTACLAPTAFVAGYIQSGGYAPYMSAYGCSAGAYAAAQAAGANVNFSNVNGVPADLAGHQMPNSPEWTVSVGAQYVFHLPHEWNATLRGDYYWQDQSYARIFNAPNDLLHAYDVLNATLTFTNHDLGVDVQIFCKNITDNQPLTGVYLTNDTSGLFQNVFTLDPRTFGVAVTKRW